jgi:hypothetical protein
MKTITFLLSILVCVFGVTRTFAHATTPTSNLNIVVSQKPPAGEVFGSINGHRQQNGVLLSWTIITTEAINGFAIERSYDGVDFFPIGELSTVSLGWNRYKDEFVFPGLIHYRVKAIMGDGSIVTSPVEMVRIVSKK